MQRKTITTLRELGQGDRFVFLTNGTTEVWQVMKAEGKKIEINRFLNGKQVLKFNDVRTGKTKVMFLRHTIPVPGETCFIEDLKKGDVFFKPGDVITEYEVVTPGHQFSKVKKTFDKAGEFAEMAGIACEVIFVRHKAEAL